MDTETADLLNWARSYKLEVNTLQINESTYNNDLKKCISTLVVRIEKMQKTPSFIAYRDHLKNIRTRLEELKN